MVEGEYKSIYLAYLDFLGFSNYVLDDSKRIDSELNKKNFRPDKQTRKIQGLKYRYRYLDLLISGPITNYELINTHKKYLGRDLHVPDFRGSQLNSLFFSDSTFIWTESDSFQDFTKLITIVLKIIRGGLPLGVFPIRGAISHGYLIFENIFRNNTTLNHKTTILGDSVVKAVKLEENQNWAGIGIHQDCIDHLKKECNDKDQLNILFENKILVEYNIPFNNESKTTTKFALNWINLQMPEAKEQYYKMIRKCFKNPTNEKIKKKMNNTLKFVDFILK
jgi:hypothetical protein